MDEIRADRIYRHTDPDGKHPTRFKLTDWCGKGVLLIPVGGKSATWLPGCTLDEAERLRFDASVPPPPLPPEAATSPQESKRGRG